MSKIPHCISGLVLLCLSFLAGCETDGFVDPSRTGYFETTPSAMPILGRIDVIEQASEQPDFVKPDSADLKPSSTVYTFAAGDVLQISIPNLMQTGATEQADRIVDQSGYVQLPVIGKVLAAGLDTEQFEEAIVQKLKPVMGDGAKVFVMLKEGRSFQYRVLGSVDQPGIFGLTRPDFRLLDALATARGASANTARILITRTVFEDDQKADYEKQAAVEDAKKYNKPKTESNKSTETNSKDNSSETSTTKSTTTPPVTNLPSAIDVDNLIDELDKKGGAAPATEPTAAPATEPIAAPVTEPTAAPATEPTAAPATEPTAAPATEPTAAPATEPTAAPAMEPTAEPAMEPSAAPPVADPATEPTRIRTQLGMLRAATRQAPPVDVDQLEPAKSDDRVDATGSSTAISNSPNDNAGDQWVFDNESQSWVRNSSTTAKASQTPTQSAGLDTNAPAGPNSAGQEDADGSRLRVVENAQARKENRKQNKKASNTKVIEINYLTLVQGEPSLNIVIRPGDAIYCDSGEIGVVYIDGEISRPGVYNLPTSGRLTLSRLVAAAGGVSELAIPERCDLIRRLGSDKEACVRVSLAAIRNRGEPDIFLKPDDHLIVGTNFWALPLARFRRDLSFPNSVGFQLDRNFGNDVFGAPPQDLNGLN